MHKKIRNLDIFKSYKTLEGNTRISILFQPMWGIPYALYNFYLSLYMKSQGITDQQIGYLIAINFISGAIFAMASGFITDYLGRKKTTLIFDLISWPIALLVYMVANNFWMFVLASVVNSMVRIVSVSFTLMLVEDANDDQRKVAFTVHNAISILSGLFTPLAGIFVKNLGIIRAERILLGFAAVSMSTMMILRNHYYTETKTGMEILKERGEKRLSTDFRFKIFDSTIEYLKRKPSVFIVMSMAVLFNVYLPIGTLNSFYFAPYLTEVLKQDESLISFLGGISSIATLVALVFWVPRLNKKDSLWSLFAGLVLQLSSLVLLILIPPGSFFAVALVIILYALGFGLFRPSIDSLFAEVTAGKERAGLYGLNNTLTSILSAMAGFFSGKIYNKSPVSIYILSIVILLLCFVGLISYALLEKKTLLPEMDFPKQKKDSM